MIDILGWTCTILTFIGVYLISSNNIKGQYVHLVSNHFWVAYGILSDQYFISISNIIFFIITFRNLKKWKINNGKSK